MSSAGNKLWGFRRLPTLNKKPFFVRHMYAFSHHKSVRITKIEIELDHGGGGSSKKNLPTQSHILDET